MSAYIKQRGIKVVSTLKQVNNLLSNKTVESNINKTITFSQFKDGVKGYWDNQSGGKWVLNP